MSIKPMLCVEDLIEHSKSKGIVFNIISESDAEKYLDKNNNYFKLTSYRKNYAKITSGSNQGKYAHLDFAHLIELARLDVEIRHLLLKMCLDIEHFLKVSLIKAVEDNFRAGTGEDGYRIVVDFLTDTGTPDFGERANAVSRRANAISRKIRQNQKNPYCKGLMDKYHAEMPIWAFVEVISFGDLKELIQYYSETTGWSAPVDLQSLDRVRQIRNAAAHNNCIVNDLTPSSTSIKTPLFITRFVSSAGIGQNMRAKKLSNERVNQIVHLLYVYDCVVTSENTRRTRLAELDDLFHKRMVTHADYFKSNQLLTSTYEFFLKLVEKMNPPA